MNKELHAALKKKFNSQMGPLTTKYGTLSSHDANKLAKKFDVTFEEVAMTARRFGVLVDDPYSKKETDWHKDGRTPTRETDRKSPSGSAFSTMTGEVFCEASVGELEDYLVWTKGRNNRVEEDYNDEDLLPLFVFNWTQALYGPSMSVTKVLDNINIPSDS